MIKKVTVGTKDGKTIDLETSSTVCVLFANENYITVNDITPLGYLIQLSDDLHDVNGNKKKEKGFQNISLSENAFFALCAALNGYINRNPELIEKVNKSGFKITT